MVNKVTLIGNLGRDPELFQTQSGRGVARLSIATNEVWTKDGERQRRTEWHRVVVWGPRAERIAEQLRRGTPVYVEGRLRTRTFRTPITSSRCARRFIPNA
jgi:single-strand DNA-binding protein